MKDVGIYAVPILTVLADEMMYHRKTGVFPSQKRIVNELAKKCGITRTIRTYNRWAAVTESGKLLRRKKRHRKTRRHGWEFRTSLYTITGPGWNLLIRMGRYTYDQFSSLIKEANATFHKPKKPRKVFRSSGDLTSVGGIMEDLGFDTS